MYQLKPHFNVIEGVELNSLSSKKGSELFDIKIYNDDLKNLSLKSNSYDCIILNQVIEHLNNFDLFDEIKRILKPGGIVYIGCPNMDSISMKFLKQRHIHTFTMVHLNMFNFKSFNYFSKKMGLRIISLKTDNFLDIWLNDLVGYFFNKKKFLHRFNDIYILNLFNVGLYMFSSYFFNKTNLLQKYKKGSYLEVILQKK